MKKIYKNVKVSNEINFLKKRRYRLLEKQKSLRQEWLELDIKINNINHKIIEVENA